MKYFTRERRLAILGMTACFSMVFWVASTDARVSRLESRGRVPVDDVATIGDLVNLEHKLKPTPFDQEDRTEEAGS